jgi:hypothetical protein
VYFEFDIDINQTLEIVYDFFWTLDERDFSNNELVPVYERITEGPRKVGSIIREVVKAGFYDMEIFSEIIDYEPNHTLFYRFYGGGIVGDLRYLFESDGNSVRLVQQVNISFQGFLKILNPLLPYTYCRAARWRLREIKKILDEQ